MWLIAAPHCVPRLASGLCVWVGKQYTFTVKAAGEPLREWCSLAVVSF